MKIAKTIINLIESEEIDLESIADYLSNAYENDSKKEAISYIQNEFGIDKDKAEKLLNGWNSKFSKKPIHKTKEITTWLKTIL